MNRRQSHQSRNQDRRYLGGANQRMITENYSMHSGDSKTIAVSAVLNGEAVELTGALIVWAIAKNKSNGDFSSTITFSKSIGAGITVTDILAGEFEIELDPADTADLKGDFYHEAEIIDFQGRKTTILDGVLSIQRDLNT